MTEKIFKIGGMHCAACSASLERFMSRQKGVQSVSVNLVTEKMTVCYDESLDAEKIAELVSRLSFSAQELLPGDISSEGARKREEEAHEKELSGRKSSLMLCIAFSVPLLYISMGRMLGLPLPIILSPEHSPLVFSLTQLVLTLPVLYGGRAFFINGFGSLFRAHPNMDSLVAVGSSSAFLYGIYALIKISLGDISYVHSLFFESAAVVLTLVLLGKYMEAKSKHRTSDAIRELTRLAPNTATVTRHGQTGEISASELREGDVVTVMPGGRFPCDGEVISGSSTADVSMLTGESIPVSIGVGSTVVGGSLNGSDSISFVAKKVGSETALAGIIRMVEDAQGKKAPIAKAADKVAAVFVPAVIAAALISAIVWAYVGKPFEFVLNIFVSVLVVACPCSLGLATPTAILVGTGRAAELGILYKSGEALQTLSGVDTVVFDKTGTLTEGRPVIHDIISMIGEDELIAVCASAEKGSEHPLARAIVELAEKRGLETKGFESLSSVPGRGIRASLEGKELLIGNRQLMLENSVDITPAAQAEQVLTSRGEMLMFAALSSDLIGLFGAGDEIRADAQELILSLHNDNISSVMLTGDNEKAAQTIARKLKLDSFTANILPSEKLAEVERLKNEGRRVCTVGDGINDAPALAASDVGVAIGSGTDVAIESADVILMGSRVSSLYTAIRLSKAVMRNIKENLFWAFFYNTIGIPFAAGVFYALGGPLLSPMIAGAAMALSSVSVVSNALRLRGFKVR